MIRLFVIEDHLTVIISSFRFLFRPQRDGIQVAGFSSKIDDVVKKVSSSEFDLFILDLYIPGHLPLDNIRKLRHTFPDKPIVIFTNEKSSSWKAKMIQEGAMAYITKDATREEIKMALQKASIGEHFNPSYQKVPEVILTEENLDENSISLTPLQFEIIKLLSEGLVHKQISDRTGVSRSLIEKILKKLRQNFQVKNNVELIKLLTKTGSI